MEPIVVWGAGGGGGGLRKIYFPILSNCSFPPKDLHSWYWLLSHWFLTNIIWKSMSIKGSPAKYKAHTCHVMSYRVTVEGNSLSSSLILLPRSRCSLTLCVRKDRSRQRRRRRRRRKVAEKQSEAEERGGVGVGGGGGIWIILHRLWHLLIVHYTTRS